MSRSDATMILQDVPAARAPERAQQLLQLVYGELHGIASRRLSAERPDHTLQPTALVHEAYLRLVDQTRVSWQGQTHFLAVASEAMRRILIDHARSRSAHKRGGGRRIELSQDVADCVTNATEIDVDAAADLVEALERFSREHPRQAQVATMRFLGGMEVVQIAHELGVSERTVVLDWRFARSWLRARLDEEA